MTAQKMSAQEIIAFIGNAEKKTNVKVTFEGEIGNSCSCFCYQAWQCFVR